MIYNKKMSWNSQHNITTLSDGRRWAYGVLFHHAIHRYLAVTAYRPLMVMHTWITMAYRHVSEP